MPDITGRSIIEEGHGYVAGLHLIVHSFIYQPIFYSVLNTSGWYEMKIKRWEEMGR